MGAPAPSPSALTAASGPGAIEGSGASGGSNAGDGFEPSQGQEGAVESHRGSGGSGDSSDQSSLPPSGAPSPNGNSSMSQQAQTAGGGTFDAIALAASQ
ncbi:hypothetical protein HaLaN_23632 [Haematococcus lacustris]|uniref:Uncharacterized protein n=1 Tax=Haematococcus lacustris TaxID=44745 RepID=A0A6A0A1K1_HAELA|nr:hypothetical protein HaLaN_23632 [Haematococcus lacustris]